MSNFILMLTIPGTSQDYKLLY